MAKPIRTFTADVKQKSIGLAGPDQIEYDLDNVFAMFNPLATLRDGSLGGIDTENIRDSAITTSKLANGSVTPDKVATGLAQTLDTNAEFGQRAINVKWYGAKGDGITDDTAAIQSAMDALGEGTLFFPAGSYLVQRDLNFNKGGIPYKSFTITGAGQGSKILLRNNAKIHLGSSSVRLQWLHLRDLYIEGESRDTHDCTMLMEGVAISKFDNLYVTKAKTAVQVFGTATGSWYNVWRGCHFYGCGLVATLGKIGDTRPTTNQHFLGCVFHSNIDCFDVIWGSDLSLMGCTFDGNSGALIKNTGTVTWSGIMINGTRFEGGNLDFSDMSKYNKIYIRDNYWIGTSLTPPTITTSTLDRGYYIEGPNGVYANLGYDAILYEIAHSKKMSDDTINVLTLRHRYDGSGVSNIIRLIRALPGGWAIRLEDKTGSPQWKLDNYGETSCYTPGKGIVVTTPDGTKKYRIRVDNAGTIVTELVS